MKFLIFNIAFSLIPVLSLAYDMGPFINEEMVKVENQNVLQDDLGAHYQLQGQVQDQKLQSQENSPLPMNSQDQHLQNLEAVRAGEQTGSGFSRPQTGLVKTSDPAEKIQEELAQKDHYNKTRNNYRKAVQREFTRRALQEGITPNRNIAEEIKELESRSVR